MAVCTTNNINISALFLLAKKCSKQALGFRCYKPCNTPSEMTQKQRFPSQLESSHVFVCPLIFSGQLLDVLKLSWIYFRDCPYIQVLTRKLLWVIHQQVSGSRLLKGLGNVWGPGKFLPTALADLSWYQLGCVVGLLSDLRLSCGWSF